MKIQLKTVLIIIGMVAGAVVWAYAIFTPRPVHKTDIDNAAQIEELKDVHIKQQLKSVKEDVKELVEYWKVYNTQQATSPETQ